MDFDGFAAQKTICSLKWNSSWYTSAIISTKQGWLPTRIAAIHWGAGIELAHVGTIFAWGRYETMRHPWKHLETVITWCYLPWSNWEWNSPARLDLSRNCQTSSCCDWWGGCPHFGRKSRSCLGTLVDGLWREEKCPMVWPVWMQWHSRGRTWRCSFSDAACTSKCNDKLWDLVKVDSERIAGMKLICLDRSQRQPQHRMTPPRGWVFHKHFGRGSIHAKLPAKLAFVPYPWSSRMNTLSRRSPSCHDPIIISHRSRMEVTCFSAKCNVQETSRNPISEQ